MVKKFSRIEPTDVIEFGNMFKRKGIIKRFQTEDGLQHEFTTYLDESKAAVSIIAITDDGDILLTYEFRPGPEKWLYQFPIGAIEDQESPELAAKRELEEETGYTSDNIRFLGNATNDGFLNIVTYVYIAKNCKKMEIPVGQDKEESEQGAEMRIVRINDFINIATSGQLVYGSCALMALDELIKMSYATVELPQGES